MSILYKQYKLDLESLSPEFILDGTYEFGPFFNGRGIVGLYLDEQTDDYIKYKLVYTDGTEDYIVIPFSYHYAKLIVSLKEEFPTEGSIGTIYVAIDEKISYIWSSDDNSYIIIGGDYNNITVINGGKANGF